MRKNKSGWLVRSLVLILWTGKFLANCLVQNMTIPQASSQCELYLAESTIPNAGLGVFTTVAKAVGDSIGNGDPAIPIIDIYRNNKHTSAADVDFFYPLVDYVWDGGSMGMAEEVSSSTKIDAYWPGLDCAINSHLPLVNVAKSIPSYQERGVHRSRDPGAGAFTPYHDGRSVALSQIPAGAELFKDYGDIWFQTRKHTFGSIPLSKYLYQSVMLLTEFDKAISQEYRSDVYNVVLELKQLWDGRGTNALPDSLTDVDRVVEAKSISVLYQQDAIRDPEWLKENGKCIDNIVSRTSTISGAGNGAFAKRVLQAGSIITRSPLHHIPDPLFFDMKSKGSKRRTSEAPDDMIDGESGMDEVVSQKQLVSRRSLVVTSRILSPYSYLLSNLLHIYVYSILLAHKLLLQSSVDDAVVVSIRGRR